MNTPRARPPAARDKTDLGVGRGDPDVHGQGHGNADSHCMSVEGPDYRFPTIESRQGKLSSLIPVSSDRTSFVCSLGYIKDARAIGKVSSRAKRSTCS